MIDFDQELIPVGDLDEKYAEFAELFSDDYDFEDRQRVKGHRRARREKRETARVAKEKAESNEA